MEWYELHKHFDQSFDFFTQIDVKNSSIQQGVPIHPLIKLSTGLVLKTMSKRTENRLVILLPNRLDLARWIVTFCALEVIRNDYKVNFSGKLKFTKGQKLLVDNCVVEFDGEEFSHDVNRWVMRVRCSKNSFYSIPLDRKLKFQPVNTKRPLSSLEKVKAAYYSSETLDDRIDSILGIKSQGNRAIFQDNIILVSKIGETTYFIQENVINNSRIMDLFQWGKLDVYGNVTPMASGQIEAKPSSLIVSDLFGVAEYVASNPENTKGFIIDGVASCVKDLQRLDDDILRLEIPTIVIADLFETELLHYLEERNFKIWQWNKNNISKSKSIVSASKKSPFASLNRSLSNYTNQQIICETCEHWQLTELVERSLELSKAIDSEDDQLQNLYGQLVKLVNEFSRLIWLPDQTWTNYCYHRIQELRQGFDRQKLWMREEVAEAIDIYLKTLENLTSNPFPGEKHKPDRLHPCLLQLSNSDLVAIVVSNVMDAEAASQYWRDRIPGQRFNQLRFLSVSDLLKKGETLALTQVIICGWLNHSRVYPLLHTHLVPKITMLLYPFEAKWFRYARGKWRKQNSRNIKAKDFSDILKFPENKLGFVNFTPEVSDPSPSKAEDFDFDIIDFELKVKRYRYASYAASGSGSEGETVKAKTVVFSQNRFAFITETHHLLVISDFIHGKASKRSIPRRDLNQLQVGDYVLFRESDKDIIREIADKALAEKNLRHLRNIASLWKVALQKQYEAYGRNPDELVLLLWEAGCEREPATIKNWLFDEGQIGPADKEDIERIARATGDELLLERQHEVEEAIRTVRGAHLQAAGYITRRLLANLVEILDNELDSYTDIRPSMVLDLDDFGEIRILRVEEIIDEWKDYDISLVNRLLP